MNDNNTLTEQQSLELITRMISETRTRLVRNSGTPFLIWGYATVAVAIFEYFVQSTFTDPAPWLWAWWAIPVIGIVGMLLFHRRDTGAKNYLDRTVSAVWAVCSISILTVAVPLSLFYHVSMLFSVVVLIGIGTTITGRIIRDTTTTAAGFFFTLSALIYPLRSTFFGEIPSDAAALIVYAPQSDISEDEADILSGYVKNGGKLLVMAGPVQDAELTNLYSILAPYGVTPAEGVVIEGDRAHYAFSTPALLMPDMAESGVTQALIDEGYYIILPIAAGLELGDNASSAAVTSLLTTSDAAYSKAAGYDMTTYDKEEGDTDGPFSLGVQIEYEDGGGIVWISSGTFLEDMYNAYSSGANVNLAMNALSSLIGESETMSIRAKSLNYNYLTISDSTAGLLKFVMIGLIPLAFLAAGITVVVRRRRLLK